MNRNKFPIAVTKLVSSRWYILTVRILEKLRELLVPGKPLIPREPVSYRAIGVVRNKVREARTWGWDDVRSDLFLAEDLTDALEGIEGFSHVIVLFHMHRVTNEEKAPLKLTVED